MRYFARIVYIAFAIWFFLLTPGFGSTQVRAAGSWVGKNHGVDLDAVNKNPNSVSKTPYGTDTGINQVIDATCWMGMVSIGPDGCTNDKQTAYEMFNSSALGGINSGIAMMYDNPPADLALWIRDTGVALGFMPKQAMAQGVGFTGLAPLLPLWKAFRNIAYVLLALAMVVIGFMVMMRKKIDPKTVVTVQNALPRIVISLLLITFSYAIVGLLIDVMYLIIAFINIMVTSSFSNFQLFPPNLTSGGLIALIRAVFTPVGQLNPGNAVLGDLWHQQWGTAFQDFILGALFNASGVGFLFQFLVGLAYLYAFIRILFMLLGSYTQILLAVLTGPLQILADVFPGSEGFMGWIKGIVANLAVFPVTIFLLLLGTVVGKNFGGGTLWTPPLLPQPLLTGNVTIGGLGGMAELLITLGVVLSIPNVANGIKESLKAKSPFEAGPGMIFGPLARGTGTLIQTGYQFSMIGSFLGLGKKHDGPK